MSRIGIYGLVEGVAEPVVVGRGYIYNLQRRDYASGPGGVAGYLGMGQPVVDIVDITRYLLVLAELEGGRNGGGIVILP